MLQLINQPINGQMGTILIKKLSEQQYKSFIIVSAFAKNSGVLRLKQAVLDFRNRGGTVDAFIGVDANGTSYEALRNLLSLVDNLYVVHDNNPAVTFHPKVYCLSDLQNSVWMAVGSNNLTGGGLWTNIESTAVMDSAQDSDADILNAEQELLELLDFYKSNAAQISMKITGVSDLDQLLSANLLRHEIQLQIDAAKARRENNGKKAVAASPFGTRGLAHLPKVKTHHQGQKVTVNTRTEQVTSIEAIVPTDASEKMWFETREMTGGSRNILDLSMLGSLLQGSGKGTRYETNKASMVLGSVAFFDVDPTNTTVEKDVTINYKAIDYQGCTIKLHQTGKRPNGSWRIQLKGETASGEKLTTAESGEWLVHKVIVLEKIRTDYYVMSVLPETELNDLKAESIFVARNGTAPTSKQFGLLDI